MPEGTIDQKLYDRLIRAIGWVEGQPNYGGGLRGSAPVESAALNVFRNNSGETVPAYAVMEVEDVEVVDNRNIPIIKKPTGDATKPHIVNGPVAVTSGSRGRWQWGTVKVAVTGTPTTGAEWGVSASSWVLSSGGAAIMRMLGELATGYAMAQPLGGGSSSGGVTIVLAEADEDVSSTTTSFDATVVEVDVAGASSVTAGTAITVKNLDFGALAAGGISVGDEQVFQIKTGMYFLAYLCDDGDYRICNAGGVFI